MTCSASGADAVGEAAGVGLWQAGAVGSSTGLGNRPVTVKTPARPGCRLGVLLEQATSLLTHGLAQLTLEGRIGCSEWLGQIPQIVGLTELMTAVGQDRGDGRHQARLFVAEDGQNRPLQVFEGGEERLERGLIQRRQPPTA